MALEDTSPQTEEASSADCGPEHPGVCDLMERVVERRNLLAALKRVERNKGGAGVDGVTTDQLRGWLREHWPRVRDELLSGRYHPQPVRQVSIPKPNGGTRNLGIPTVVDRFIQQALLQVLQSRIDPTFSEYSYGFRPGRSAHGAVRKAKSYVLQRRHIVVDVDLARFFDRVNHDVLMSRVARHVQDRRVLRLIREYLTGSVMVSGVVMARDKGTPQGGPLSPLLANILLDEVDKELERRGHTFVRYADDLNVYVRSQRAGERVMEGLRRLFAKLHLQINEEKSAVAEVGTRKFLGFTLVRDGWRTQVRISESSLHRMKQRVRELTKPTRGASLDTVIATLRRYLLGWKQYYRVEGLTDEGRLLQALDVWIRRRLRCYILRQWRRGDVMYRELLRRGVDSWLVTEVARHAGSYWRNSDAKALRFAFPNRFFESKGVPMLSK